MPGVVIVTVCCCLPEPKQILSHPVNMVRKGEGHLRSLPAKHLSYCFDPTVALRERNVRFGKLETTNEVRWGSTSVMARNPLHECT